MTLDEMARSLMKALERIGALEQDIEYLESRINDLEREDHALQGQIDDCVRHWEIDNG